MVLGFLSPLNVELFRLVSSIGRPRVGWRRHKYTCVMLTQFELGPRPAVYVNRAEIAWPELGPNFWNFLQCCIHPLLRGLRRQLILKPNQRSDRPTVNFQTHRLAVAPKELHALYKALASSPFPFSA